jgi:hypothetical protein
LNFNGFKGFIFLIPNKNRTNVLFWR